VLFSDENIFYPSTKQATFNQEVSSTKLSLSVRVPFKDR
jgi:hypothetical protein